MKYYNESIIGANACIKNKFGMLPEKCAMMKGYEEDIILVYAKVYN